MAEIKEPVAPVAKAPLPVNTTPGEGKTPKKRAPMTKKQKRKIIRIVVILAILVAVGLLIWKFLGNQGPQDTGEVITDTVQYGSITSTVEGSGLTKPKDSKTITLTATGTVQEVYVTEGDVVEAGKALFSVDSPAARTAVQTAQTEVAGYQKQITALNKDLAGLNLKATYSGKLMDTVKLQKGAAIAKGDKVATLVDDTKMLLKQYYSYAYSGEITSGQAVTVSLPALTTTVGGTVESVHMVGRVTAEGSQLFEADIVITNPGSLTADMAASASFTVNGESVYPYEAGKLEYYRSSDLTAAVGGTVLSSSLMDYMKVSAGQVLVKIDGEDSSNQLFTLQQQLKSAQEDLEKAKKAVSDLNAVAPIGGTVLSVGVAAGDELTGAAVNAVTIADTSTILIDANVDERNISYVKAGSSVDITDWENNVYTGTVESVSLTSTVNNGVASYPMVISVDNTDGKLFNGSNINYSLVASQSDNCLVLPIQCVKSVTLDDDSAGNVVFVQSETRPEAAIDLTVPVDGVPEGFWPVPVEIGISDSTNVEIKSGVEEGTVVFTQVETTSSFGG